MLSGLLSIGAERFAAHKDATLRQARTPTAKKIAGAIVPFDRAQALASLKSAQFKDIGPTVEEKRPGWRQFCEWCKSNAIPISDLTTQGSVLLPSSQVINQIRVATQGELAQASNLIWEEVRPHLERRLIPVSAVLLARVGRTAQLQRGIYKDTPVFFVPLDEHFSSLFGTKNIAETTCALRLLLNGFLVVALGIRANNAGSPWDNAISSEAMGILSLKGLRPSHALIHGFSSAQMVAFGILEEMLTRLPQALRAKDLSLEHFDEETALNENAKFIQSMGTGMSFLTFIKILDRHLIPVNPEIGPFLTSFIFKISGQPESVIAPGQQDQTHAPSNRFDPSLLKFYWFRNERGGYPVMDFYPQKLPAEVLLELMEVGTIMGCPAGKVNQSFVPLICSIYMKMMRPHLVATMAT